MFEAEMKNSIGHKDRWIYGKIEGKASFCRWRLLLNKEFNDFLLKKLGPQTEEYVKMKEKAKRKPE